MDAFSHINKDIKIKYRRFVEDCLRGNRIPVDEKFRLAMEIVQYLIIKEDLEDIFDAYAHQPHELYELGDNANTIVKQQEFCEEFSKTMPSYLDVMSGEGIVGVSNLIMDSYWYNKNLNKDAIIEMVCKVAEFMEVPVGLFGSFVRGQEHPLSDVDLVLFTEGNYGRIDEIIPIVEDMEDQLSILLGRPVNVSPGEHMASEIRNSVIKDIIMINSSKGVETYW